ncbi:unnamed protein product [Parascedosporium putredinis]|uniref:[acyl-carrier-protein] S-malonyltransferase n=1 Tax=Parascedosporium putredinis TaxID=1442378 RepID=A0A9P1H478_9PEZI|nr:unnamed protein product [Parascedosporium putredinis]CAI7995407.1 unnamed protein product [Parascedosporium putredinis]
MVRPDPASRWLARSVTPLGGRCDRGLSLIADSLPNRPKRATAPRFATKVPSTSRSASTASGAPRPRPRTALFFPGVQKVGMLTPWLEAFPATTKPLVEQIDHWMGYKLSEIIQSGTNKTLTATSNAQPAIMATSILILQVLEKEFGFDIPTRVDVTLGHSLGEFAALVAGRYMEFEDSLYVCTKRAIAMEKATQNAKERFGGEYGMVAIVTEPEYLLGLIDAVNDFQRHSSTFGSKQEVQELLARQTVETVRWWDSIKYLDQESRVRRWIGIGPGKVGRNLVGKEVGLRGKDVVKGAGVWAITAPEDIEEVLRGLEETEGVLEDPEEES